MLDVSWRRDWRRLFAETPIAFWHYKCCPLGMIGRCLLVLLAFCLAGSLGAFLFYVPIIPILLVILILGALVSMFVLGFCVGHPAVPAGHDTSQSMG